jgi:gluconate 2-dehydrogenase gamma chain
VKSASFTQLSAQDQDAVLTDMENNAAKGFPGAALFFNVVLSHTMQGTFCDPFYGGNANFVGWDLIGYPGMRLTATANDQRMDVAPRRRTCRRTTSRMFSRKKPDAR